MLLDLTEFDPELTRQQLLEGSPLRGSVVTADGLIMPADMAADLQELDEEMDSFLDDWDEADRQAVALLREALPQARGASPPASVALAAAMLRQRLRKGAFELRPVLRTNGWKKRLPADDARLWIETVGGLILMRDDTGLAPEDEALLASLEHGDWAGAVIGMVRGGVGAPATARRLVSYIGTCPEIEGEVDDDERDLVADAFDLILPIWQAAGAIDDRQRVTELGRWGLPRSLAWAWAGDFDAPSDDQA